jgi:acyl-CoA thioesterase FadM
MLPIAFRALPAGGGSPRPVASRLAQRVHLSELDLNRHMNQAVYAAVYERARLDWVIRSRAWKVFRDAGVNPVVGEQHIVYRRELGPAQRYEVDTRVIGTEGRLVRFEQYLLVGDRVHGTCHAGLLPVGPDGVLSAEAVAALAQPLVSRDRLPVEDWHVVARAEPDDA